eukprot:TRINITY_DN1557_c0_g1_i9.p1 TRINITY_DN1557_c0_g1~~TRINITY_DN1557_c0_g1_i9.p1  ORF type:complete len:344 (+),score=69.79 TRINITY_DN1557_c0_g1_i9:172-1203(+)
MSGTGMALTSSPQGLIRTSVVTPLPRPGKDVISGRRLDAVCARSAFTVSENVGKVKSKNGKRCKTLEPSAAGLRILALPKNLAPNTSHGTWQDVLQRFDQLGNRKGGALSAEMNIFSRIGRIFRSFVESIIGSQEDPEKIVEQAVLEMTADLVKLRQTTALVMASKMKAEVKYNEQVEGRKAWYKRAAKALEQGDEPLAKEALRRKKTSEDNEKVLKSQLDQQIVVLDKIMASSGALERKIADARGKKDLLKARAQTAKTSKYVNEVLGSVETGSSLAAYRQMEEKVERLEAEAEAVSLVSSDDLSTKFAKLETAVDVDDDLQALKRTMLARPNSLVSQIHDK